ncbi:calcium-binding protein [Nostoc sp. C117]|uniref:calcium-binding protein n=1 Tax=Nostoc sp. C117 TaxID=3349875 RepID=UPI00370D0650
MTFQVFRGINYTEKFIQESNQQVSGTANSDWFVVEGSNNVVNTQDGNDVVLLGRKVDSIFHLDTSIFSGEVLQTSPLSINCYEFDNLVRTGAGDDYVSLGVGNNRIFLGDGNNFLDDYGGNYVFDADNNIIGLGAIPKLFASAGAGDDIFYLSGFADRTINAGKGNNLIFLGAGDAKIDTGSGNDVITSEASALTYIFDSKSPSYRQNITAGNGDNQIAVIPYGQTTIKTGNGEDFIVAVGIPSSSFAKIDTGDGNDTVITNDTNSMIKSGSGNNLIFAGSGNDSIRVGNGNNLINLRGGTVCLSETLSKDTNLFGSSVEVKAGGNDNVYLGEGENTVVLGSSGFASIYGFGCNDRLNISGLNASFSQVGRDTLISSCGTSLGVIKEYTGSVKLA